MAILLENQAKQLVNEASGTGTGTNINTGNSEAWAGVALPLVRRVFGEIVAKDLLSVQPMNLPSGLIFYLDFQYGGAGSSAQPGFDTNESLYGASSDLKKTELPTETLRNQGLYGAGRFGYSINATSSTFAYASAGSEDGAYTTGSATFADILNLDTQFSASVVANASTFGAAGGDGDTIKTVLIPTADLGDFDPEGVRAFTIASAGTEIAKHYPQFTRIKGDNV